MSSQEYDTATMSDDDGPAPLPAFPSSRRRRSSAQSVDTFAGDDSVRELSFAVGDDWQGWRRPSHAEMSQEDATATTSDEGDPSPLPAWRKPLHRPAPPAVRPHRRSSSVRTFAGNDSVHSDAGAGEAQVGNLRFLNDADLPAGQSAILGRGSFGTVRLARRGARPGSESGEGPPDGVADGRLVAVKVFEKSLLARRKTVSRDAANQVRVHTALEGVEREIAVLRRLRHPNLLALEGVIDRGGHSDKLFLALEYAAGGEVMSHVPGSDRYARRPARAREGALAGVLPGGHFDERRAALYFVDVLHGLAHLHRHRVVHRDLKPENVLLDSRGVAKIGDFGACHCFEDEAEAAGRSSFRSRDRTLLGGSSAACLTRVEADAALNMKPMSDTGHLTTTEGTWAYWSPEMCAENSQVFSGYACDVWAAGICLHIFATGKLPFYSNVPTVLFEAIAAAELELDEGKLSVALVDALKGVLARDPVKRAGIGDLLRHPFCQGARRQRIRDLSEKSEVSRSVSASLRGLFRTLEKPSRRRSSMRRRLRVAPSFITRSLPSFFKLREDKKGGFHG